MFLMIEVLMRTASCMVGWWRIGFFAFLALNSVSAYALTSTCKENLQNFDRALSSHSHGKDGSLAQDFRVLIWMSREMDLAGRQGCDASDAGDAELIKLNRAALADAIRMCRSLMVAPGACEGSAPASYRRPDIVRPGSDSMQDDPPTVGRVFRLPG